jgi:hypothetical protein
MRIVETVVCFLSAAAASLAQPTALNTFGPGNSYDPNMTRPVRGPESPAGSTVATGHLFVAQASGTIASLLTAMHHVSGSNTYTIQIRLGDANQVGAMVESFPNVQASTDPDPIFLLQASGTAQLNAGQTYWLCAIGHGSATGSWYLNDQNMNGEWSTSSNQGATWFLVNGSRLPAARINLVGPAECYANCDGSTVEPILNVADFTCFLSKFAAGDPYANCDGSTTEPILNVADFTCFLTKFAAGCD